MEVSDGGEASRLYAALASVEDKQEVEKIRTALREYCKLDTFAMARVLGKLREIGNRSRGKKAKILHPERFPKTNLRSSLR